MVYFCSINLAAATSQFFFEVSLLTVADRCHGRRVQRILCDGCLQQLKLDLVFLADSKGMLRVATMVWGVQILPSCYTLQTAIPRLAMEQPRKKPTKSEQTSCTWCTLVFSFFTAFISKFLRLFVLRSHCCVGHCAGSGHHRTHLGALVKNTTK